MGLTSCWAELRFAALWLAELRFAELGREECVEPEQKHHSSTEQAHTEIKSLLCSCKAVQYAQAEGIQA